MSPPDQTSIVVEIPCQEDEATWQMDDAELIRLVRMHLQTLAWFQDHPVIEGQVRRLDHAYPVLEKGIESKVERVSDYLSSFENLVQCGRNATFLHSSMHDVIRQGKDLVESLPPAEC